MRLCAIETALAWSIAASLPTPTSAAISEDQPFYWQRERLPDLAELVTLHCHKCIAHAPAPEDLPLLTILRDTAGAAPNIDVSARISYVWLLTSPHTSAFKRGLASIPFFYWRIRDEDKELTQSDVRPQFDLTAPATTVIPSLTRRVVQWTALDPFAMWMRATSRNYASSASDYERTLLAETITYLRQAPAADDGTGLSDQERKLVIARLELKDSTIGALASGPQAKRYAAQSVFENERIQSRNWELLRLCAEKTGLYFEPINLGYSHQQFGMLWMPVDAKAKPTDTALNAVWKVLNIKNPWVNKSKVATKVYRRTLTAAGQFTPSDTPGGRVINLLPVAFYSLSYSRVPLLLVDFRERLHVQRREIAQRSINELTAGVLGLSHFANWYYYAASLAYNFVAGRHGLAVHMAERLTCYAEFRVQLDSDGSDDDLRSDLRERSFVSMGPLSGSSRFAAERARQRLALLQQQIGNHSYLAKRLEQDRRREQAAFGRSVMRDVGQSAIRVVTLGSYQQKVSREMLDLSLISQQRRFADSLDHLDLAIRDGTNPEMRLPAEQLAAILSTLRESSQVVDSLALRHHATRSVDRLIQLVQDQALMADCQTTLALFQSKSSRELVSKNTEVEALRMLAPRTTSAPADNSRITLTR